MYIINWMSVYLWFNRELFREVLRSNLQKICFVFFIFSGIMFRTMNKKIVLDGSVTYAGSGLAKVYGIRTNRHEHVEWLICYASFVIRITKTIKNKITDAKLVQEFHVVINMKGRHDFGIDLLITLSFNNTTASTLNYGRGRITKEEKIRSVQPMSKTSLYEANSASTIYSQSSIPKPSCSV